MRLTALVLAGGQSTRMGQDKALIPVQGVPMLRRVCEVALACTPDVAVVTSWPDRYRDVIPAACRSIQEPLPTSTPGTSSQTLTVRSPGPLVGFAYGLSQIETDWVLLLACDLPRLESAVLQQWITQLDQVPQEAIAYLSKQPAGWEPLCGFYRDRCLSSLQAFISQGGRSFQNWLAQETVAELPPFDSQMLFNCNTPADLP